MCQLGLAVVSQVAAVAVALAVISPKAWHDVALDAVGKRWGIGPNADDSEGA